MIGSFDESNVVFALLPKCEANFRTVSANTGAANLYNGPQSGGLITATMTNMGSGYGFRATEKDYFTDNTNDYLALSSKSFISEKSEFTIYTRIKLDQIVSARNIYYSFNSGSYVLGFYVSSSRLNFLSRNNTATAAIETVITDLNLSNYHNCAVTFKNGTAKIYINGAFRVQGTFATTTFNPTAQSAPVQIGRNDAAAPPIFESYIHFNKELSLAEIQALDALGPDLSGLVATDNGNGTMAISVPVVESGINYHKSKYFPFANSFGRKRNKR